MKDPLCSSSKDLDCVLNVEHNVTSSACLPHCSGLIVSSFTKSDQNKNMESLFPVVIAPYNVYKTKTEVPYGYKGIIMKGILLFPMIKYFRFYLEE